MVSFRFLAVAALAGFAAATPIISDSLPILRENSLSARQDPNNCTQYCSIDAGCVCQRQPSDCTATYLVQPDDTCGTIAGLFNNFTQSILYYWNPDIGPSCFGLRAFAPVCINTPWYTFFPPTEPAIGSVVGNSVPTEQPIPLAPFITATDCNKFELAGAGADINEMEARNGINDTMFFAYNGGVNQTNRGVWSGYFYCVGVSGSS
ncbi:hypothetical protein MMC10_007026 [Thelotrema lepadinum]|nr:hypothetical protein [Thelotrema lepadinum]